VIPPDDPRHGTLNGYSNLKCRCQPCREAWASYCQRRKAARPPLPPDDPRHGLPTSYANWKCRCPKCTEAWTGYYRALRHTRAS
jgi:hypothetical protein